MALREPYGMVRSKPRSALFKASTVPTVQLTALALNNTLDGKKFKVFPKVRQNNVSKLMFKLLLLFTAIRYEKMMQIIQKTNFEDIW